MIKNYYEIADEIEKLAIIPVIALNDAKDAEPLGQALVNAGLLAAEVTFRTDAAEEAIKILAEKFPQICVGAGTVLTPEQAQAAYDAGAKFVVSPGFNPTMVDYCIKNDIPVYPGVNNPSGIEAALERGLDRLKFFPAEASGGVNMVKNIAAPYGKVKFMATGGINLGNVEAYLDCPYIIGCGGSWMVKSDLINNGKFDEIEQLCKDAVKLIENRRK